jgi:FKBP-type peptidyl-prolyl cis-trans isomerase 2
MAPKENDFIEIEFIAKVKDGEVFDTNIKEEIEKLGSKVPAKPFIFRLGRGMFLKGVEDKLIGKDIGKTVIELTVDEAFGKRKPELVKVVPEKIFKSQNLRPVPGVTFNFDGSYGKVLSVSGGRIRVDFNNPIAGKDVTYEVDVKRVIDDKKTQAQAVLEFLTRKEFDVEIKDEKAVVKVDKQFAQILNYFKNGFKELSGIELEIVEEEPKKEEKPIEKKE